MVAFCVLCERRVSSVVVPKENPRLPLQKPERHGQGTLVHKIGKEWLGQPPFST